MAGGEPRPEIHRVDTEQADQMADAFAAQAAGCLARRDTAHPVFRGCIDWHSAVHAAWTLTAHRRAWGDASHSALLAELLSPAGLELERADLRRLPAFELPYGRAWFLRLALESHRLGGDPPLDALGADVAASLVAHYEATPPDPRARDYDSATWALVNLLHYGREIGDARVVDFVVHNVRRHVARDDLVCPMRDEARGFLSVCVTWAWLVAEALPREEFLAWYARWNPGLESLQPLLAFSDDHSHGKNFSRAWGLRQLASATGDARLHDAWHAHVAAGWADWLNTRGDYGAVGHWVAQFGMLAVMPHHNPVAPQGLSHYRTVFAKRLYQGKLR